MPTIDERSRLELFEAVQATVGAPQADTLMSLLPPVGWADVATRHDLHELERRLDLRFEAVDHRFEAMDHRFEALEHKLTARIEEASRETTRTLLLAMIGTMATLTSLCLGAIALAV